MHPASPEFPTSTSESSPVPTLGKRSNRFAIAIVLVIHLILLAFILMSRWVAPVPPKVERSTEVVVYMPKIPPPKPPEPTPVKAPPAPTPPTITPPKAPELPKLEFKPDAIVAPPTPPAPPAPAPAAPPAPAEAPKKAEAVPAKVAPPATQLFAECADTPNRHMIADVYRLPTNASSLKVMDRRKPVKRVCMTQLDVEPRNFNEGFPGLDMNEWFGLDIRFTVTIAEEGNWDIMTLSDDGSSVTVDGKEIISNDGIHPPKAVMETVLLTKGVHNFRVRYFQGPGPGLALMLAWKKEGTKDYVLIPQRLIGRPPAESLPEIPAAVQ